MSPFKTSPDSGKGNGNGDLKIDNQNFQNVGETIIDAGTPKAGEKVQGVCGMGMYSFAVDFK